VPRIWISIGSNIDAEANVLAAVTALKAAFGAPLLSPVYRTAAIGFEGPPFLNLVAGFDTDLPPGQVLSTLAGIEDSLGRRRGPDRFDSRTVDLDLLTYGDQTLSIAGKELPRDEILDYAFVLKPLADVAPGEHHPVDGRTYRELWRAFTGKRDGMTLFEMAFHGTP